VVGIKHDNRKENCAGSEDVTRDHRCVHLAPSVTPLARTSRLMRRRRYSHVDRRRLLASLGSADSSGLWGRRRLPAQGPAVARPLDRGTASTTPNRGTSATARRGNGVAATGLGTAVTAQGHCRRSPSGSEAAASTSDRGTAATACRGRGVVATVAPGGRGSTVARAIGQPSSLMNRDET
jgi:hypothetical protein